MSYQSCIIFIALFYPAIFINAFITKSRDNILIGSCAVLIGCTFTYIIYNDAEFWIGWIIDILPAASSGVSQKIMTPSKILTDIFRTANNLSECKTTKH